MIKITQEMERCAWRIAAAMVALLYLLTVPRQWQCEGLDEIEYLSLAHSLVAGQGYTIYGQPHVLYPPLYAGLLSLPWRLTGGAGWGLMYGCNAALGAAGLVLLGSWLRRRYGEAGRWAAWALVTAYYPWSFSTRYLLSEPLFFLLSALLLLLVDRARLAVRVSTAQLVSAGLLAALAALTRFAAVTLLAGVAGALLFDAWRRRAARLALMGLLIGGSGLAVLAGWEIRAERLNPHATESYGKWVQALTGAGGAAAGKLAARTGEGLDRPAGWPKRLALTGVKTGQYLLSVPRVSPHFIPLGLGLCGLMLLGLAAHLRRDPTSPAAWYVLATLLVVSATSWVSSYHRYLYPLSPLLFFFAAEGVRAGWAARTGPPARVALAVGSIGGLAWWIRHGWPAGQGGAEGVYTAVLAWGVAALFMAGLGLAVRPRELAPRGVLLALVVGLALQNCGLVALRYRQTLLDATPVERNLVGLRQACAWLRGQAGPGDRVVSTLPSVASFLCGRRAEAPTFDASGAWCDPGRTWVILSGPLHDFPAYRGGAEDRLAGALAGLGLRSRFSFGPASVYERPSP